MTEKFGLVSYDEVDFPKPNAKKPLSGGKDEWMRLEQGNNELRIITDPYQYVEHRYKAEGDKGYGDRIRCSAVAYGSCPICDMRDPKTGKQLYPPKKRWLLGVIDRKTNTPKILDISKSVFMALKKFNSNERIGDPKKYDINIEVDKNADPVNYYSVQNYPKEPLSEADVELKKSFNLESLKKRCVPPSPDSVKETLLRLSAKKGLPAPTFQDTPSKEESVTTNGHQKEVSEPSEPQSSRAEAFDDEDEFEFPSAQV